MNRYIKDADYTAQSLYEDIRLRIEAHSYISPDDLEAYQRAEEVFRQQQVLWEDTEGLLDEGHDHAGRWAA